MGTRDRPVSLKSSKKPRIGEKGRKENKSRVEKSWKRNCRKAKKFGNKIKEKAKAIYHFGKNILKGKLARKKTKTLVDLNIKGDSKWQNTKTTTSSIKGRKGMGISYKGNGEITVKFGYMF